jgi:diguanylate cyclase (GGDEF)-like protein
MLFLARMHAVIWQVKVNVATPPVSFDVMDISRVSGEFSSHATEARFLHHHLRNTQSLLRFTLLFCAIFYLGFWVTDVAVLGYGHEAMVLLAARTTVAITAVTCAWLTYRNPRSISITRLAACIAEAAALAAFMCIAVYRPAEFHWHAMSLAIMLIVVYLYIPNRLGYAMAVAVMATVTLVVLAKRVSHMSSADMFTMTMLLLLANAFGAVAARRFQRVSREQFRAQSILEHAAVRDHLTGCFNRRYLHDNLLNTEMARAERFGRSATVIICDLDHFKQINDTYGHAGGDAVLRVFSSLLKQMTREHVDSVVRYGGEEFVLILPETDLHRGVVLAERLRAAFAASATPTRDGRSTMRTTASFGVASVNFTGNNLPVTLSDLLSAADELMYDAKKKGRNRVESLELI